MMIAGVDEVGRGPLAGPVVAAAVILNLEQPIDGLRDSKCLTHKQRILVKENIQRNAIDYAIAQASVSEIDQLNILQATFLAMRRAIFRLRFVPDLVLIDGNQTPIRQYLTYCCIRGDQYCLPISAASILAKTARDDIMISWDLTYSQYGFAQHKGYGTSQHLKALEQNGLTPLHRMSFKPCRLYSKSLA